jgi:formylglycine-generating enzyme required for sulfatase activity
MGSPEGEGFDSEYPKHKVTIAPFYMSKFPVTQEQWETIMGNNPSFFKGAKRPVERVSWNDAVEFCEKLAKKTGKSYRLPSEAEWEYACRAGTTTPFYFGKTTTPKLANYGNEYKGTTEVGKFPPNAFGIYDMSGNVWELCADVFHASYQNAPTDGSVWGGSEAQDKVMRGGAWNVNSMDIRCASRGLHSRSHRDTDIGLRLVRTDD